MPSMSPLGLAKPEPAAIVVRVSGEITALRCETARAQLRAAWHARRGIALHLDTHGGEIFAALWTARCIAASQDLVCFARQADSAGLLLLAGSPYRFAPRRSEFIFHQAGLTLESVIERAGDEHRIPRALLAEMMADVERVDEDSLDFLCARWRCSRRMLRDLQRQNACLTAAEMRRRGFIDVVA